MFAVMKSYLFFIPVVFIITFEGALSSICIVSNITDLETIEIYHDQRGGQEVQIVLTSAQNVSGVVSLFQGNSLVGTLNSSSEVLNVSGSIGDDFSIETNRTSIENCSLSIASPLEGLACEVLSETSFQVAWNNSAEVGVEFENLYDTFGDKLNGTDFSYELSASEIKFDNLKSGYFFIATLRVAENSSGVQYVVHRSSEKCSTTASLCNVTGNSDLGSIEVSRSTDDAVSVTFTMGRDNTVCCNTSSNQGEEHVFNSPFTGVELTARAKSEYYAGANDLFKCTMDNETLGLGNQLPSCSATQTTLTPTLNLGSSMTALKYRLKSGSTVINTVNESDFQNNNGGKFSNLNSATPYEIELDVKSDLSGIIYVLIFNCDTQPLEACNVNNLDYLSDVTVDMRSSNDSSASVQMKTAVNATVSNDASVKVIDLTANTLSDSFAVEFGQNYTVLEAGGRQCYITLTNPFSNPNPACEAVDQTKLKVLIPTNSNYVVQIKSVTTTLEETDFTYSNITDNDGIEIGSLQAGSYYFVTVDATEIATGIKYVNYVVADNCTTDVGTCNSLNNNFEIAVSRSSTEKVTISFPFISSDLTVDSGNGTFDVASSPVSVRFQVASLPDTSYYECTMDEARLGIGNNASCRTTETSLEPLVTPDHARGMQINKYTLFLNGNESDSLSQNEIAFGVFSNLNPSTDYTVEIDINSTLFGIEYVIDLQCTTLDLLACDLDNVDYLDEVTVDMTNVTDSGDDVDITMLNTVQNSIVYDEASDQEVFNFATSSSVTFRGQIGKTYSVKNTDGNKCLVLISNPFNESSCQPINTSSIEVSHRDGPAYTFEVSTVFDTLDRSADDFHASENGASSAIEVQNLKSGYHYIVSLNASEAETGVKYVNFKIEDDCATNASICDATDDQFEVEISRTITEERVDIEFSFSGDSLTGKTDRNVFTSDPFGQLDLTVELANSPGTFLYECFTDNATLGLNNEVSCNGTETTIQMYVELDVGMSVISTISSVPGHSERIDNEEDASFSGLVPNVDHSVQVDIQSNLTEIVYVLSLHCQTTEVIPPHNLTTETNQTSIAVSWQSVGESGEFRLSCSGQSCPQTQNISSEVRDLLITGLVPGKNYTLTLLKVIARVESAAITAEVSADSLDAPTSLTSSGKSPTSVNLTWTSSDTGVDVIEFVISCSANRSCPSANYNSGNTAEESITALIPGELYTFAVKTHLTDSGTTHESDFSQNFFVRTDLNSPDLSDVPTSHNQSNILQLPVNPCDTQNTDEPAQTISSAIVFWDNSGSCQNRNSKEFAIAPNCQDSQTYTLDPISDNNAVGIEKGSIICLNLTLISNSGGYDETSSSETSVSLYPDSVNPSVNCNNSQLNQLTFDWEKGSGIASSFDVKLFNDSQLVQEENETAGNAYTFNNLLDGTEYTFQIWTVSNGLRSLPVEATCRSNIAVPQFTAVAVIGETYRIEVQSQDVYFSSDMIMIYYVYNRSEDCANHNSDHIIEQTINVPSNDAIRLNDSLTPGRTYWVRLFLQAGNESSESYTTVDIPPSPPGLSVSALSSSTASVEMTNPLSSSFVEIDPRFFYFELDGSKVEIPSNETIQMGTQNISTVKAGAVMQLKVTLIAANGLNDSTETVYRIPPKEPEIVAQLQNDTSCQFTVQSGEIVQKFNVNFNRRIRTIQANSDRQADFAYDGLLPDSVHTFTITATSDYNTGNGQASATSNQLIYK